MFTPHPLQPVKDGDIIEFVFCSKAMGRVDKLYQPGKTPPLLCLHCHPELDPRKQKGDIEQHGN